MKNPIGHLSNLQQRIIAGVIGAFLLFAGILTGMWPMFVLILCMNLLCLNEFYLLFQKNNLGVNRIFGLGISAFILLAAFFIHQLFIYTFLPCLLFILFLRELFRKNAQPFSRVGHTILGLIYITLPFYLLQSLTFWANSNQYDPVIILAILLLVWASDIGGYVAGLNFGKHKLFERISPKKTWEGAIGSLVFAILIAYLFHAYLVDFFLGISDDFATRSYSNMNLYEWIGLSIVIVVFGILGDLVESMLKRSLGVKDSGNTIPGHGGFLDRFDAFVFVIPFVWAYLQIVILSHLLR